MSKKNDVLKDWEDTISVYSRLDIESAKIFYNKILNEKNEAKKHEMLNTLINGTLYVVLNFIKRNKLSIIKTPKYDIGDIINTCNELWIIAINSGALLEAEAFADIFDRSFCTKLSETLNETDFIVSDLTLLNASVFYNFLYDFIEFDKINGSVSYEDFCRILYKSYGYDDYDLNPGYSGRINAFKLSDSDLTEQTYKLALNIVEALKDENDDISLTRTKIDKFKYLYIEAGLQWFGVDMDQVYETDFADRFDDWFMRQKFVDAVLSCKDLDDRKRDIVVRLNGLNGNHVHSRSEVAEIYGLTEARVGQLAHKAYKFLRRDPEVRKYR